MTHTYNTFGQKISTWDIDAGTTTYEYDGQGRLRKETDANGKFHTFTYDVMNRITQRSGPEGITTYQYHGAGNGYANQLASITGFNGVNETFDYDSYGRLSYRTKDIDTRGYATRYTYNAYGDVESVMFPSGMGYRNYYDQNGILTEVQFDWYGMQRLLFSAHSMNGNGQYTSYSQADWNTTTRTYNYEFPASITSPGIQDLHFDFEVASGNLLSRQDNRKQLKEVFTYDNLDRLTSSERKLLNYPSYITPPVYVDYDQTAGVSLGNILQKTDAGDYFYPLSRRHAVAHVTNTPGNISTLQQDITYTPFRKTETVKENNYEQVFTYGADYQRVKTELLHYGSPVMTRYYDGDFEETTDHSTGAYEYIHYIYGGDGLCAIVATEYGMPRYYSVYKDHLGSILTLTDEDGAVVAEQSYDAWGRERNAEDWTYAHLPLKPRWLYRGYTGHEHMPEFSIINMNGRMYDPLLGRMLSPDNYVMPAGSQGYNRYTYGLNNPLKYTDPTGEWVQFVFGAVIGGLSGWQTGKAAGAKGWDMVEYIAGGAGIGLVTGGVGTAVSAAGGGAIAVGAASGAVAGAGFSGLQTNWDGGAMLKGAVLGGVSGAIGGGVAASIGGGWGAFAGGAVSSGFQSAVNGDNIGQIGLNMLVGGGLSYGLYHANSYINWKYRGGNKWGEIDVSYRQYTGMQADMVKSRFYRREYGGYLNSDGTYEAFAGSGKYPFKIDGVTMKYDAGGNPAPYFHAHWASPGSSYYVSNLTGQITNNGLVTENIATRYFSPVDLPTGGPALMLNRFDGAYSPGGNSWVQINPDIYRYFPYIYNFW